MTDEEIVRRVQAGEAALFELLMRRHNRGVYRAVRAVVLDENEVEDVMQQAYLSAYSHLDQFAGTALFSTWLVRIAVNQARSQRRNATRARVVAAQFAELDRLEAPRREPISPEAHAATKQLTAMLEAALDRLPEIYRTVFILREVEGLDTAEAADALAVSEQVVKIRLHRAKALVRQRLDTELDGVSRSVFDFDQTRCDRVVAAVLSTLQLAGAGSGGW